MHQPLLVGPRVFLRSTVPFVTFDNQPVHVLDVLLVQELFQFCNAMVAGETIRAIVFDAANKDIFLAHGDMNIVAQPETFAVFGDYIDENGLNMMQKLHMRIQNLKQVTIGKLEALIDIIPDGGGIQFLTQLVGKSRAMEIILLGNPIDTQTAVTYGLIKRAFSETELDQHIQTLADRINSYLPGIVPSAKQGVEFAHSNIDDFSAENELLGTLFSALEAVQKTLNALRNGTQTLKGELQLETILENQENWKVINSLPEKSSMHFRR